MLIIGDCIRCLAATDGPLSADVGCIKTAGGMWLYDVGASEEALRFAAASLGALAEKAGQPTVVLSHFHADHTHNLGALLPHIGRLFVSRETFLHARPKKMGEVLTAPLTADGLCVFPLPSSHAKGCLGLLAGEYAFVGDALYGMPKGGQSVYNAQLLQAELQVLRALPARMLLVSHHPGMVMEKQRAIDTLQAIYALRSKNDPLIVCAFDAVFREG